MTINVATIYKMRYNERMVENKTILLTIEYDGSEFSGWQRQPDRPTVQEHLEKTLSSLLGRRITVNGTSRTDAGVHAYGQRASFSSDIRIPTERLAAVINNSLRRYEKGSFASSPVRIVAAEEKPAGFHARFDSKGKKYIYRIKNADHIDVFERNYIYHVKQPLDLGKMRKAAAVLKGTHDFKAFEASGGTPRETTVRTIFDIDVREITEDIIEIHVSGDGFLYNMVRIITGTLVDMGTGRLERDMEDILKSRDRKTAGHTAPPYGLYLAEVYY